ncbi:hypothetical protein J2Z32_001349 [Paenibacillus turicensis]|uniref:Uncharacterized protein n=1 Tax=Paenibacillus turicensis TaxID=160487 RepID=A0ABS4FQ71_9BACL|nr:hypothetical protein [Paenibacillus turicensis]MBP1904725.1 hypothetical protein [Paenibacillus turicensis]
MNGITLQEMSEETVQQLQANYVRQPAFAHTEGTAEAYTVNLDPKPIILEDGFGITIVPHVTNEAEVTLNINGLGAISLKDQKGKAFTSGKLQAGKPYTFRKVGIDFLADSSGGSGDAVAGDIRAGKVATTDNGDVVGMLPVRTGGTVTPSTTNQTKQAGIYDSPIVVEGSPNLVAGNIKQGVSLFGVSGSYTGAIKENVYKNLLTIPNTLIYIHAPTRPYLIWFTSYSTQNVPPYNNTESMSIIMDYMYLGYPTTLSNYVTLKNGNNVVQFFNYEPENNRIGFMNTGGVNMYSEIHVFTK